VARERLSRSTAAALDGGPMRRSRRRLDERDRAARVDRRRGGTLVGMTSSAEIARADPVAPILKTKLQAPGCPRLVVREDLIQALSDGLSRPLTLVYGPAGSGKTMLVAQWLASVGDELPVAWLSLDGGDNDPGRFWIYVVEAVRSVLPAVGDGALAVLNAPGAVAVEEAILQLINELVDVAGPSVLVLDDYHVIEDERIHRGMATLLEHLPGSAHIVITSRVEPPLGVGTLRARGRLNEVDATRLRFSRAQAESLLNEVHGLGLSGEMVTRLNDRTEGWAAGLYLAVLSMRGREDVSAFIESFAGSDRRIVDYLGAEVLAEQPEEDVAFLLQTSVLDRFCAPLCNAVTGGRDARAMLDRIERANYFLIPLDGSHDWYRYHQLFGELLRHELERSDPGSVAELHRRAGRWFLDAGLVSDAIRHLTAAGEVDEASDLIAANWLPFTNVGRRATVAQWLEMLPRDHVLGDGRLCLARCRTALMLGEREEMLEWLDLAEQARTHNPATDTPLAEQATVLRSIASEGLGDMHATRTFAAALEPLDGSSLWHALAASNLGAAARWLGESAAAARLFGAALQLNRERIAMVSLFARGQLALIAADDGDWRACSAALEAGFDLARRRGLEEYWQCSLLHVARGRLLHHERNAGEARAEMERAVLLARRGMGVVERAYILVTLAELLREAGDRRQARDLVLEARELLSPAPEPGTVVPALVARAESRLRLVLHRSGARSIVTDELTAREEAVLRLLPSGLSAREIGGALGVSLDTIKTHTKSIYRKLGATSRRDAVVRARELELL
jgi:LuxR family maltose regulon positive regulatory protein